MEKAYFVMEDKVYFVLLTVQNSYLLPVAKHVLTYFTTKKIKVHMLEMFVFDGLAYWVICRFIYLPLFVSSLRKKSFTVQKT